MSREIEVTYSDIEKCQIVALYYTAGWCPPCRVFNQVLSEFYNDVNYPDKRFEVIQITSDQDEVSFHEYFGNNPWIAIPFNDPRIKFLKGKFKVTGIPLLLLLNRDGTLAHGTARADIQNEGPACFDKWINQFYT